MIEYFIERFMRCRCQLSSTKFATISVAIQCTIRRSLSSINNRPRLIDEAREHIYGHTWVTLLLMICFSF